jgi:predicted MPP superfamily phosphohydrolase
MPFGLMNRRSFILGAGATALTAAVAAPIIRHEIETHRLERRAIPLALGLNRPLRVAALGDIHFDPLFEEAYLAHVADSLTDLQPDLIVYTGDFVTHHTDRMPDLAAILGRARSRLGSYATLGNHDHWAGAPAIVSALHKQGIRVLINESIPLPGENEVYLTALDSFWSGTPNLRTVTKSPDHSRHILLVHEPDPFAQLIDPRIRLQISGHTHGGQVRLPAYGALVLPTFGRIYQQGLYRRDGQQLYVNRGVGTVHPHVRFHCPPEITVFELS